MPSRTRRTPDAYDPDAHPLPDWELVCPANFDSNSGSEGTEIHRRRCAGGWLVRVMHHRFPEVPGIGLAFVPDPRGSWRL